MRLSIPSLFIAVLILGLAGSTLPGQTIVAHYDFETGLADTTGQQAPMTLLNGAAWEAGRLKFNALTDSASATIPNSQLYISGTTQAIELDAWVRSDSFVGYGVNSASIVSLVESYNAMLSFTRDKWQGTPYCLLGYARQVATPSTVAAYWPNGISHHLQLVLDTQNASVWIDGHLVAQSPATGDLALWARTAGVSTLTLGQFSGIVEEVTIIRHNTPPTYISKDTPFQITHSERLLTGNLRVQWNSRPGTQYTVETSTDLATWTPQPTCVTTATTLISSLDVCPTAGGKGFARVRLGNAFDSQGPLLISHTDGQQLIGGSELLHWLPNGTGIDEWIVKAGSSPGGSQYFQIGRASCRERV